MSIVIEILRVIAGFVGALVVFGVVEYSLRYVTHDEVVRAILAAGVAISTASVIIPGGLGVCS